MSVPHRRSWYPFRFRSFDSLTAIMEDQNGLFAPGFSLNRCPWCRLARTGGAEQKSKPNSPKPAQLRPASGRSLFRRGNGFDYLDDAFAFLKSGGDTLDAALKVVKGPEDDPNEDSVGLGGLPNEEGVVELDSCCMHGPTRRAGFSWRRAQYQECFAGGAGSDGAHRARHAGGRRRRAICRGPGFSPRKPAHRALPQDLVAVEGNSFRLVGAGFGQSRLEEDGCRRRLMPTISSDAIERMKEVAADIGIEPEQRMVAIRKVLFPPTGTIHCSALNEKGEISGTTTTSGLAWKLPGTLRRFSDHRSRLLHRPGCGFGGRHGQRRRKHQGRGRAHHCGEHAPRHVATRRRHGRAEAHRAQLQRRYGPSPLHGHDLLRRCAKTAPTPASRCGTATNRASRTRSRCTTEPGGRRRRSACSRAFRRNGRRRRSRPVQEYTSTPAS